MTTLSAANVTPLKHRHDAPQVDVVAAWLVLAGTGLLVLCPLVLLIVASFRDAAPGQDAIWTLDAWRTVFGTSDSLSVLLTTLAIALPRALLGLVVATGFAWIVARTNTPGKGVLEGLLAFMFFLPDLPWVLAWGLLGAPNTGFLNQWVRIVFPDSGTLVNVYSYGGLIVLGAARAAPILFLIIHPTFEAMDAGLEEASRVAGASGWQTFRTINLPLLMPALLATGILSLVRATESFEMEQLLGTPARIYVFTTRIYDYLYGGRGGQYGPAVALSIVLLVLSLSLIVVQGRLTRGRAYATVTGRGFSARVLDLGRWRWLTFAMLAGFVAVFGALPFAVLVLDSFLKVGGFLDARLLTTAQWTTALSRPSLFESIRNTLVFAAMSATFSVVICLLIAYINVRSRWSGRSVLQFVAWIPWGVPGLVLALGFLWVFVYLPIYGTLWALILAQLTRSLPIGSQAFGSTMQQVGSELEEASTVHGAGWASTFVRIWLPLLNPMVISTWILLFVISFRVLDTVLLLASPGTHLLSVDIFQLASSGRMEQGAVLSLIQTGLIVVGYTATRLLLRRAGPQVAAGRFGAGPIAPPHAGRLAARPARSRQGDGHRGAAHRHPVGNLQG